MLLSTIFYSCCEYIARKQQWCYLQSFVVTDGEDMEMGEKKNNSHFLPISEAVS